MTISVLLRTIREEQGLCRDEFCTMLGITPRYCAMIESGKRQPGLPLLRRISERFGYPLESLLGDPLKRPPASRKTDSLIELSRKLNYERSTGKKLESTLYRLETACNKEIALAELQSKYVDIVTSDLAANIIARKTAALAREMAQTGQLSFVDISIALRVTYRRLKSWLEPGTKAYSCKMMPDRGCEAATRKEAGIAFGCFDCEFRNNKSCEGYIEEFDADDLYDIIRGLEANGILSRTEQARILQDNFNLEKKPHDIADFVSKSKKRA